MRGEKGDAIPFFEAFCDGDLRGLVESQRFDLFETSGDCGGL